MSDSLTRQWVGCHLYHHGDQGRLLRHLLRPMLRRLLGRGWIDRFFFVRSALGGPHLRLRLRIPTGELAPAVLAAVGEEAAGFFRRWPADSPLAEDEIRRRHRAVLATDPAEHDDTIYPDNSCRVAPFQPEIERYGGPLLLPHSLDLFALSSVVALETLAEVHAEARSSQLATFLSLLAQQALASAGGEPELFDLLARVSRPPRESFARILRKADLVFAKKPVFFCRLLAGGRDPAAGPAALADGARRLRQESDGADASTRARITVSQLHMTANRLGVTNPEELYLGRLLDLAAAEIKRSRPDLWAEIAGKLAAPPPTQRLADLAAARLARFAAAADPGVDETEPISPRPGVEVVSC